MGVTVQKGKPLAGVVEVPGDKSISHRAAILGALAEGKTVIRNFLHGEDCLSTLRCLEALGVPVIRDGETVVVEGVGLDGLKEPADVLDAGNSGTTARLLLGVLAGQPFYSVLTGDASLRRRPMGRVIEPLAAMGARFFGRDGGKYLPVTVIGGQLAPANYRTPVASAQLKSALLLAALYADGWTRVHEPAPSRDHTERMLAAFGAEVNFGSGWAEVHGRPRLKGQQVTVPGDISSAAFFMVAAAVVPGSDVLIKQVGINPTRTGIIDVLREMGADLSLENVGKEGGEPVADIRVRGSRLRGVEISGPIIPRLIDELPVLAVAALYAEGETVVRDAAELRVKETDRIAAMTGELRNLGGAIEALDDGFRVRGSGMLAGGRVRSHGDHRVAMSLAVAALNCTGPVEIDDTECIAISYPGFLQTLASLGASVG